MTVECVFIWQLVTLRNQETDIYNGDWSMEFIYYMVGERAASLCYLEWSLSSTFQDSTRLSFLCAEPLSGLSLPYHVRAGLTGKGRREKRERKKEKLQFFRLWSWKILNREVGRGVMHRARNVMLRITHPLITWVSYNTRNSTAMISAMD